MDVAAQVEAFLSGLGIAVGAGTDVAIETADVVPGCWLVTSFATTPHSGTFDPSIVDGLHGAWWKRTVPGHCNRKPSFVEVGVLNA